MRISRKQRRSMERQLQQKSRIRQLLWQGAGVAAAGALLFGNMLPKAAYAMPAGGQVAAGAATIAQQGNVMNIAQQTQQAIINWQAFNIAAGERVNFLQPNANAAILNRILGNNPSQIFGAMTANGRVFLVNPAGVFFAPGAQVSVGSLVASSLNISNADFMAGRYAFVNGGKAGSVINQGKLIAENKGLVALLGPEVENSGVIVAKKGTAALVAGDAATLDFNGDGKVTVVPGGDALQAVVNNKGLVEADGGVVFMTAQAGEALTSSVVNQSGIVRATSLDGKGGSIDLQAKNVNVTGTLDASGAQGGGTIRVGGDWQGSGTMAHAQNTTVSKDAVIKADATENGNGGKVVLWSDGRTQFDGTISAKAAGSGDGGKVETSGHQLGVTGNVDASAKTGKSGEWLLDPENVTITGDGSGSAMSGSSYTPLGADSSVTNTSVQTALEKNDVTITTGSTDTGTAAGNITVNGAIKTDTGHTLNLRAANNIVLNADITGKLNLDIESDTDGKGGGAIQLAAGKTISTNKGYVKLYGGADGGYATSENNSMDGINIAGTIETSGGDITLLGNTSDGSRMGVALVSGSSLDAGTGTVNITANNIASSGTPLALEAAGSITGQNVNIKTDTASITGSITKNTSADAGTLTVETLTAGKAISLGSGSGLVLSGTALGTGFDATVIGNADTGTITVGAATAIDSNVTLKAKAIALDNNFTAGTASAKKNLTLNVGTSLSAAGAVAANTLDIEAPNAAVSLTNVSNDVAVLQGKTAALTYTDSNGFTVGPITATGAVTLTADGTGSTMELTDALNAKGAVSLTAGKVTLDKAKGSIQADGNAISLKADSFTLPENSLSSTGGTLNIDQKTAGQEFTIGAAGNTLPDTKFAADGFTQINIGSADTGAVTIGDLTVSDPLQVTSGTGITVNGKLTGNDNGLSFAVKKANGTFTMGTGASISAGSAAVSVTADQLTLGGSFASDKGTLTLAPYTSNTAFTVGGNSAYVTDADLAKTAAGFKNVIVGSSTAGAVTIAGTGTTMPDYLTIKSGSTANITGAAGAKDKTLVLAATGVTQSQSAALTGNLLLLGSGNAALTNTGNQLQTVAADLTSGDVSIVNSTDLTVGSLPNLNGTPNPVDGINTSGTVNITTAADKTLLLKGNIAAGAGKVTLSADNITDTSGTVTTTGILQIYTTTPAKGINVGSTTDNALNLDAADFSTGAFSSTYKEIILGERKSTDLANPLDPADQSGAIHITKTTFTSPLELRTTAGTEFTGAVSIGTAGDQALIIHAKSAALDDGCTVKAGDITLDLSDSMDLGKGTISGKTGSKITLVTPTDKDIYLAKSSETINTGYKIAYETLNSTLTGYGDFTVQSGDGHYVYMQDGSLNKSGTINGAAGVKVTGDVAINAANSTDPLEIKGGSFSIAANKKLSITGSDTALTTVKIDPTGDITLEDGAQITVAGKADITMDSGSSHKVTLLQNAGITVTGSSANANVTLGGGTVELGSKATINLGEGTGSSFTLKADTLTVDGARNDETVNITGKGTLNLSTYSTGRDMYVEHDDTSSANAGLHVLQGDINGDIFGSGFTQLNIGNEAGTGTVHISGVEFKNSVTIQDGSQGTIDFQGENKVDSGNTVTLKAGAVSNDNGNGSFAAPDSTLNIYTNSLGSLTGSQIIKGNGTLGISSYDGNTAIFLGANESDNGLKITNGMLTGDSSVFGHEFTHYSFGSVTPKQQLITVKEFTLNKNMTLTAANISFAGAVSVGENTLTLNAATEAQEVLGGSITAGCLALQGGIFDLSADNAVTTLAASAGLVNFTEKAGTMLTVGSVTTPAGAQTASTTINGISTSGDVTLTTDQLTVSQKIQPTTTDKATLTIQQKTTDVGLNIGDGAKTEGQLNLGTALFNDQTIEKSGGENSFKQVNLGNGHGKVNISSSTPLNFYDPTSIFSGTTRETSGSSGDATTITKTAILTNDNALSFRATTFTMDADSSISAGNGNLSFRTDTLNVTGKGEGNISGSGEVTIDTLDKARGIELGTTSTATDKLKLPSSYFDADNKTNRVFHDGYSVINFGRADGTGMLTQNGTTNFTDKVNILQGQSTSTGGVTVNGTINTGGNDFDVSSNTVTIKNSHVTTTTGNVHITTDNLVNDITSGKNTIESTGGGSLTLTTYTKSNSINLGSTTGTGLNIDNAWFNTDDTTNGLFKGFKEVTFGDSTQTGGVKIGTIDTTKVTNTTNIITTGTVTDGGTGSLKVTTLNVTDPTSKIELTSTTNEITNIGNVTGGSTVTLTTGSDTTKTTHVTGTVTGTAVTVGTQGNVDIAKGGKVTSTNGNVDIEAKAGHFTNTDGGSNVLTSTGGRWIVHTYDSVGDTPGALAPATIRYGTPDITATTGNTFAYVYQPTVTIYSERTYGDGNGTFFTIGNADNAKYSCTMEAGRTLTKTEQTAFADLQAVAKENKTGTYGWGRVNENTAVNAAGGPNAGTIYGTGGVKGTYDIAYSGANPLNYAVKVNFVINPRTVVVKANDQTKIYDGTSYSGGNGTSYGTGVSGQGFILNDLTNGVPNAGVVKSSTVQYGTLAAGNAAVNAEGARNAGSYGIGIQGSDFKSNGNYVFKYVDGTLTVTPLAIEVSAGSVTRVYGSTEPGAAGGTVTSAQKLVSDDVLSGIMIPQEFMNKNVGTYAVTPTGAIINDGNNGKNYTVSYVPGTVTITPRPVVVKAGDKTRVYGEENSTAVYDAGQMKYNIRPADANTGFVNGDTFTDVTETLDGSIVPASAVGSRTGAVTIGQGVFAGSSLGNYTVTYEPGSFTITPRPVVIQAGSAQRKVGEDNPLTGDSVMGLIFGDSLSGLSNIYESRMDKDAVAGYYQGVIHPAEGQWLFRPGTGRSETDASNYSFTYLPGDLTITSTVRPGSDGNQAAQNVNQPLDIVHQTPPQPTLPVAPGTTGGVVVQTAGGSQEHSFVDTPDGFGFQLNGRTGATGDIAGLSHTSGAIPVLYTDGESRKLDGIYTINYNPEKLSILPAAQKVEIPEPKEIRNELNRDFSISYKSEGGSYTVTYGNGIVTLYPDNEQAVGIVTGKDKTAERAVLATGVLTSIEDLGVMPDQIRAVYIFTKEDLTKENK